VIVDSQEAVAKYRKDSSIPLVDVVNSFDVFVTNKHGAQGVMDRASKSQLENEFNTSVLLSPHMTLSHGFWKFFC
jgi:ribosome maturation protein Sdo1